MSAGNHSFTSLRSTVGVVRGPIFPRGVLCAIQPCASTNTPVTSFIPGMGRRNGKETEWRMLSDRGMYKSRRSYPFMYWKTPSSMGQRILLDSQQIACGGGKVIGGNPPGGCCLPTRYPTWCHNCSPAGSKYTCGHPHSTAGQLLLTWTGQSTSSHCVRDTPPARRVACRLNWWIPPPWQFPLAQALPNSHGSHQNTAGSSSLVGRNGLMG